MTIKSILLNITYYFFLLLVSIMLVMAVTYITKSIKEYDLYENDGNQLPYVKQIFLGEKHYIVKDAFEIKSFYYLLKSIEWEGYIDRIDTISSKTFNRVIIYKIGSLTTGKTYIAVSDKALDFVLSKTNDFRKSFLDKL